MNGLSDVHSQIDGARHGVLAGVGEVVDGGAEEFEIVGDDDFGDGVVNFDGEGDFFWGTGR